MLSLLLLLQDPAAIDSAAKSVLGMDVRKWSLIDDAGFLERVTRDLWGEAPADPKPFVDDKTPDKRARKVDELLASPKFAAHWGRRLSVWLSGEPESYRIDLFDPAPGAAIREGFARWLTEGVAADRPWTEIVAAIIDARGEASAVPELAWKLGHGAPRDKAVAIANGTLGVRLGCAACHDHPYDRWRVEDLYGLAAFFARERVRVSAGKVELSVSDEGELSMPRAEDAKVKMARGGTVAPVFLFGGGVEGKHDDRLKVLSKLLTSTSNPQLPRAFVNRVWAALFGKGIVDPPDDFNLRNKAASPALLDTVTRGFVAGGYRLKPLLRSLGATQIYQNVDLTEPAKAEWSSFRGLIVRPPAPRPKPFSPLVLDLPKDWVLLHGRPVFRAPAKGGKGDPAFFSLADSDTWLDQIQGGKPTIQTIEGQVTIKLTDVVGTYACDPRSLALREKWRVLHAAVKTEKGSKSFRLEGPVDAVEAWKAEVLDMLKAAR